eukprot:CAMPEP_0197186452 /NCGR_PEP_ID=MMETSP1423-20130617/13953_1 /TAXON_ID=476441 /ORGANISM="Pseudo-nitzschia heimii, Strain UNC1101" /LENGTH=524 /DNA_ID=CAMNT_0042637777 /DNA_START=9 /DNA_END=1580 /DNA_ORIENTATION=+
MKLNLLHTPLVLLLSQQLFVIRGYILPSNHLALSRTLIPVKNSFSQQFTQTIASRNLAHDDKRIPTRDDYLEPSDNRKSRKKGGNKNQITAGTLNLIKAMLGTGILALPMGVAKTSDFRTSIIPAIALMWILGAISAYTFSLYGRLVHASQAKTLGDLWEKMMGKNSAWLVSIFSLTFCFGACLSYSLCLGDVTSSLAETIGLNGIWISRQFWILFLTTTILYPLSNLKSLISLAPLSLAGVGAVLFTTIFLAWRCPFVNKSSPYSTSGLDFLLNTLSPEQLPKFQTLHKGFFHLSSLILFGMAASAYLGHFTAPDLYHSLCKDSPDSGCDDLNIKVDNESDRKLFGDRSDVLDSFNRICLNGFLSTIIINCLVMTFGFLTFGGNSMGVILNNFSAFDKGAAVCRLFASLSVVGGYPFLISACRGEILKLYNLKTGRKPTQEDEKLSTILILSSLVLISMVISNAGFIIGLSGAVMGSALVYIFPSLLYLSATKNITKQPKTRTLILERIFCRLLVAFGSFAAF